MSSKTRAFTLIELLVVIAIIAILAAILFPVFAQARERARAVSCLSNTKQIALGLMMYDQDYDETFPVAFPGTNPINGGQTGIPEPYDSQIMPYLKNDGVFTCPSDSLSRPSAANNSFWDGSYAKDPVKKRSFGYVGRITTTQANGNDNNTGMSDWGQNPTALAALDRPAETIGIVESWAPDAGANEGDSEMGSPWGALFTGCDTYKLAGRNYPAQGPIDKDPGPGLCSQYQTNAPMRGHFMKGNYPLLDGHAKALSFPQVRGNDFWMFKLTKPTQTFSP
jgi:prepilin-type N-terminal cleavage/methylation domain-containing protein